MASIWSWVTYMEVVVSRWCSSGELARVTLQVLHQPENVGGHFDALADLGAALAGEFHREGHIIEHGHVRVERVILEHHGDVAFLRRHLVDHAPADFDLAARDFLQARDHAQQRRLAATRRPDQHAEFAVRDRDVHAVDDAGGAERLEHAFEIDCCHGYLPAVHSLMYRLCVWVMCRRIALRAARGSRRTIAFTIASCSLTVSAAILGYSVLRSRLR
jgi:hypothetical protein